MLSHNPRMKMGVAIPVKKMSVAEKLRALEEIWDDLQRTPEAVPSPAWHADVLRARARRVRAGKSSFQDWNSAKRSIRERAK
jgi:hypothetical protein